MVNKTNTPYEFYLDIMNRYSDEKTKGWIVNKPSFILTLLIPYWFFCTKIGPAYMKNRPAYKLTKLIQIYNLTQVIFNLLILIEGIRRIRHYNFICQPLDFTANDPKEIAVANIGWCYCVSRMYDLVDTVLFILRKNFRQVTALHLYHHILLAGIYAFLSNFMINGQLVPLFGMNIVVHVFMYIYYFIASLGPEYQKYLWWKKHLTQIQIAQFFLGFWHTFIAWMGDCDLPGVLVIWILGQAAVFFTLFVHFYIRTYVKGSYKGKMLGLPLEMCKANALATEKDAEKPNMVAFEARTNNLAPTADEIKTNDVPENILETHEKKSN